MPKFSFQEVEAVVRGLAAKTFAKYPDRDERTADAVSRAWEWYSTASEAATVKSLAYYAVRRTKSRRRFRESVRSIRPRESFDVREIPAVGADPAETAAFRIDFTSWTASLTTPQMAMLELLAIGETTEAVAARLGCTAGNVSQFRRRLAGSWKRFQG